MFLAGDRRKDNSEATQVMEDAVRVYVIDLVTAILEQAHRRGKVRPLTEDLLFCLRSDRKTSEAVQLFIAYVYIHIYILNLSDSR